MQIWMLWVIFAVLLFLVEIVAPGAFYFACLGVGALIASVVSLAQVAWWVPWGAFLAGSVVLLFISRPLAHRLTRHGGQSSNVDALIGQRARVIEAIDPVTEKGTVRLGGEVWRAKAGEAIPTESWVEVTAVEGTRVVVKQSV